MYSVFFTGFAAAKILQCFLLKTSQITEGNEERGVSCIRTRHNDPAPLHLSPGLNANEMHAPYEKHLKVSFSYHFIFDIIMCILVAFLPMRTCCAAYHEEHESHQRAFLDISVLP